jgi:lysophospholipase L1-like esterase
MRESVDALNGRKLKSKFKKTVFLSMVIVISLLIGLVLGEAVLRIIGFEFALYPNVEFGWPDPVTLKSMYDVDKELFWVPYGYHSKVGEWKGKEPWIVFMGCSCTEFGRYDQFLGELIYNQNPNTEISWVNVGVGGWSSYQGLQQLTRDVLPMKPRIITFYYGWNDHWARFGLEDKYIGKFNLELPAALMKLSKISRLGQLINKSIFTLKLPAFKPNEEWPVRVSLLDFSSNLRQMVKIARDNDIIPILITAPTSHQIGKEPTHLDDRWLDDLDELVPLHNKYVQAVRDVSSEDDVPMIDLYTEFHRLPEEDLNKYFLADGIHLNKEGNKKIGEFIYNYLSSKDIYNWLFQ